jgi:hypothetical protein
MTHLIFNQKATTIIEDMKLRACLGELHATPDPKKQLHSKFSPPNTPNSSSSTVDLLQKKGGVDPQLHGFHGVPQEVLHQI